MKKFLLSICVLSLVSLQAQDVYSISGNQNKGIDFKSIDEITSQTTVFENNAALKSKTSNFEVVNTILDAPTSKLMATLALNKSQEKLVYMPMVSSYVYVLDLKTKELTQINGTKEIHTIKCDEGSFFTRMTAGFDGNVYALNNNSSELIQISTQNNSVAQLGAIKVEGNVDITEKLAGWGGDMVADNSGNLYVISASANVFKIKVKEVTAEFVGKIKGLPENYTTNGAAVLQNGNILLGNSKGKEMYSISLAELSAEKYKESQSPVYDLASEYFINTETISALEAQDLVQLFPTKIETGMVNLQSSKTLRNATMIVYDLNSMEVQRSTINLKENDKQTLSLQNLQPNIYIVKVVDKNGNQVLDQKVIVSRK